MHKISEATLKVTDNMMVVNLVDREKCYMIGDSEIVVLKKINLGSQIRRP